MKLFIIIVTYNAEHWIVKCLNSVYNLGYQIILIDNSSKDKTTQIIESNYSKVRLIKSEKNLGFGQANNIGLKIAIEENAEYVLLLNQDAWLKKNTIDLLIAAHLKNPIYWILSPMQMNSVHDTNEYQFNKYMQKNKINNKSNNTHTIDFVSAAIWLISSRCLRILGGFDPIFPHYGEDNDYVNRVHYWGGRVGVVTQAIAYHDREKDGKLENSILIYKTTLGITGLLKNINNSLFYNVMKETYHLILKSFKYILKWNIELLKIYWKSFFGAIYQLNHIKRQRKDSMLKTAFLNIDTIV